MRSRKEEVIKEKSVAYFFNSAGVEYEGSRYPYMRQLRAKTIREELSDGIVLDAGCNCGHLIKEYYSGQHVIGIDISVKSLEFARTIAEADFINASAMFLPFKDNTFDYVICSEMLYYLESPDQFLEEAKRVLKSEGKRILLNSNQLYFQIGKLVGSLLNLTPGDINEKTYYSSEIINMLDRNGYKQIRCKGAGCVPIKGFEFLDRTFLNRLGLIQLVTGKKVSGFL